MYMKYIVYTVILYNKLGELPVEVVGDTRLLDRKTAELRCFIVTDLSTWSCCSERDLLMKQSLWKWCLIACVVHWWSSSSCSGYTDKIYSSSNFKWIRPTCGFLICFYECGLKNCTRTGRDRYRYKSRLVQNTFKILYLWGL